MVNQADHDGPEMDVPDGFEPIVAWRAWELTDDFRLSAFSQQYEWLREDNVAVCNLGRMAAQVPPMSVLTMLGLTRAQLFTLAAGRMSADELERLLEEVGVEEPEPIEHRPPVEDCSCGFYALNSIFEMLNALRGYGPDHIYGRVGLHGKVIVGTKGYRAGRADVTGILVVPWFEEQRQARIYGSRRIYAEAAVARSYDVPLLWDLVERFIRLHRGPGAGRLIALPADFEPHRPLVIKVGQDRAAIYNPRPIRVPVPVMEHVDANDLDSPIEAVDLGAEIRTAWVANFQGQTVLRGSMNPDTRR